MNADKTYIAIQSNYIQSITILNAGDLSLNGVYKTKWARIEMFSDEMYALKGFTMFLEYSWKDNSTIEYSFYTSQDSAIIKITS